MSRRALRSSNPPLQAVLDRPVAASSAPLAMVASLLVGCGAPCADDGFFQKNRADCPVPGAAMGTTGSELDESSSGSSGGGAEVSTSGADASTSGSSTDGSSTGDGGAPSLWCADADGDGFGRADACEEATSQPPNTADNGDDCDDAAADVFPGAAEHESALCTADADADGYGDASISSTNPLADDGTDCDDAAADVFPGAAAHEPALCTADVDADGYGDATISSTSPLADDGTDCDDTEAATFPTSSPKDSPTACMKDVDGDDYGDGTPPVGVVAGTDCNDDDATVPFSLDAAPATCEEAANLNGTLGCKFFGVPLDNAGRAANNSILLSNPSASDTANVTIERFDGTAWVTAHGPLPVAPQTQVSQIVAATPSATTTVSTGASYRITSDRPIAAYQASAINGTSDASVLIPVAAWGTQYHTVGWDGLSAGYNEYVAVVATQDGTTVSVKPSRSIVAGGPIAATDAGGSIDVTLDEGDVAVLASPGEKGGLPESLSGTIVSSSAPVGLFTGTSCSNIPSTASACDHLEEMQTPSSAAGHAYLAARLPPRSGAPLNDRIVWQVYAVEDVTVTFTGSDELEGLPDAPVDLTAGSSLELSIQGTPENPGDFLIEADGRIIVAQYLTGASEVQAPLAEGIPDGATGDPAMVLMPAVNQLQTSYAIGTVPGNAVHHLTLTRPVGSTTKVDGSEVDDALFIAVDGTWEVGRVVVAEGSHFLESASPFSVLVSGYNGFNSYAYLGGGQARSLICE